MARATPQIRNFGVGQPARTGFRDSLEALRRRGLGRGGAELSRRRASGRITVRIPGERLPGVFQRQNIFFT